MFNLTGTVLHTNLGRALIAEEAVEAAVAAMRNAVALEFDLADGKRGERDDHVRGLLCELTGAEDATVVNNNAAAVLIVLNTLARGRAAIVSRGELIEIGGAFRMPDIMARAGAKLVEVGTTNRTHPQDYAAAIGARDRAGAEGAHLELPHRGLHQRRSRRASSRRSRASATCRWCNDLGSGTLVDLARFGLAHEPTVAEAIADGADLVTFSGDKLLGGPQAGFIVGRKDLIARHQPQSDEARAARRQDPARGARGDAEALSRPGSAGPAPADAAAAGAAEGGHRGAGAAAARAAASATARRALHRRGRRCASQIGSGALPVETVPSAGLAIRPTDARAAAARSNALAAALRRLPVPVIGRIEEQALVLDLRCLEATSDGNSSRKPRAGVAGRMIVGTAGHIDHGKTALVRALTGVDTDRLKEEKARGISIDLGFAYLPTPDGAMLGFVDVPGHEKFVHNMLAGATGIDFVLLVVAADDGVMPQTREHLAIVDLLGVGRGIVALTKIDLVSPRAAARRSRREIASAARGTGLADADILPVSS